MKLKCQCCGFEQEFADAEIAFHAGWDAPPHFPYVTCDLCPGVCIVFGASHEKAHQHWQAHGRPADFVWSTCATDEYFGGSPPPGERNN